MPVFKVGKIPKRLDNGQVHLKLVGPWDWLRLYRLVRQADPQSLSQLGFHEKKAGLKAFLLLLYLFRLSYMVCVKDRAVGIAGIYEWQPGVELFLTLAILDASYRNMGIGSVCIELLLHEFLGSNLCRMIFVEVKKHNVKGLRFWKRHGFKVEFETRSTYVLKITSKNDQ